MRPPRVSVCLPVRNGEAFVEAAVASILAQTATDLELLVADDASTDGSWAIVESVRDPRVTRWQNARPLGIPGNWNRLVHEATGEYVCVFHQDDVMAATNLEQKVGILDHAPDVAMVHSAARTIDGAGRITGTWVGPPAVDEHLDGMTFLERLMAPVVPVCAPTVVMRRDRFVQVGGWDARLRYACDWHLWMRLCLLGGASFLAAPLVDYRTHCAQESAKFHRSRAGLEERFRAKALLLDEELRDAPRGVRRRMAVAAVPSFLDLARKARAARDVRLARRILLFSLRSAFIPTVSLCVDLVTERLSSPPGASAS